MEHEDKQELRRRVLLFFSNPRMSRNMHLEPEFSGGKFVNKDIRRMVYSLDTAGLIYKPRGEGPGSVYALTPDGYALMEVMDQIKALEASDNESYIKGASND